MSAPATENHHAAIAFLRSIVIALTAFVTVVDLFAAQAILPSLAAHYNVTPAAMGLAVNASTFGMAFAGLAVAMTSRRIDRRLGILVSLVLLSVPTALLAVAPNLEVFTALRVIQGLFMSAAFTLTLAYLGEHYSARDAASAFAAYITGNVASNLFGRMLAAALVDHAGLAANFMVFAGLNLAGALLVYFTVHRVPPITPESGASGGAAPPRPMRAWAAHLRSAPLRAGFAIGFCILFAFIGTFTYVNFVLTQTPFAVSPMQLGAVYLVFLPAIFTTPLAGRAAGYFGSRAALWGGLAVAGLGLPLLLLSHLAPVLAGMALVASGTFFAQATATGFVSRAATADRGAASGLYLACYFLGGLTGAAILGQLFDQWGWAACVGGVSAAIIGAAGLAAYMRLPVSATPAIEDRSPHPSAPPLSREVLAYSRQRSA